MRSADVPTINTAPPRYLLLRFAERRATRMLVSPRPHADVRRDSIEELLSDVQLRPARDRAPITDIGQPLKHAGDACRFWPLRIDLRARGRAVILPSRKI